MRPMAVEPVAETTATRGSLTKISPSSRPPIKTPDRPSGASPKRHSARSTTACTASAVSGVFSEGFQTTGSPQTSARPAFQHHTATGKLNAEMTPQTPSGCHDSIIRWPALSVAMVRPYSWRDSPTAKSQISIISWTSPRPSDTILPVSSVTRRPRSTFTARNSSASIRTNSPRRGAGTERQTSKACAARRMVSPASSGLVIARWAMSSPVMGDETASPSRANALSGAPSRDRMASASLRIEACWIGFMFMIAVNLLSREENSRCQAARRLGRIGSQGKPSAKYPPDE
jgi:hypothetical protein